MDAIIVENVSKMFKIYKDKSHSLKETVLTRHRNGDINKYEEFWALNDVSFSVPNGQTLALVGENGCGKSTMLKIVAGILQPTSGNVKVNGRISALLELGAGFHPDYSGRENIYLNGSILGFSKKELDKKFDEIVEFAELSKFIDTPVRNYSSGMYMRLGFSIAVNVDPDILLVDEVLAVGDEAFQQKCFKKIDEFKDKGKTILFVSHSADAVIKLCDRVVLLDKGNVINAGVPKKVINSYRIHLFEKEVNEEASKSQETEIDSNNNKEKQKLASANENEAQESSSSQKPIEGAAKVTGFSILNKIGEEVKVLDKNEHDISFKINITFNDDIEEPIFGFILRKDMDGKLVDVYDTNTKWAKIKTGLYEKNKSIVVMFQQNLNLSRGVYYIDCGIANSEANLFYHWKEKAATFYVQDEDETWRGILNLNSKITIEK